MAGLITGHTYLELVPRQVVQNLEENSSAGIHPSLSVMAARAGRPVRGHIGQETIQIAITHGRYKIHLATTGSTSPMEAYWQGTFKKWREEQNAKNLCVRERHRADPP
jgi:hypothetical protein